MHCNIAGCQEGVQYEYSAEDITDDERRIIEHGYFCHVKHAPAFLTSSRELIGKPWFKRLTYELVDTPMGCLHGEMTVQRVDNNEEGA